MAIKQLSVTDDCDVDEGSPDTNRDGSKLTLQCSGVGDERHRFFLKWDISAIPAGAEILGARIGIYVKATGKTGTFPITCYVFRITSADWQETNPGGITWNNQPFTHPGAGGDGEVAEFDQQDIGGDYWIWIPTNADLVELAQKWLDGNWNNYGVAVVLKQENPGEIEYIRYEDQEGGYAPILEIEYYSAETIPATDPGEDLDSYSDRTIDRLNAQYQMEPVYRATWTVPSGTDNVIAADELEKPGSFRTQLPYILDTPQVGEATLILHNKDFKYSPGVRSSILWEQKYKNTPFKIEVGMRLPGGVEDYAEQYVGLVDYVKRLSFTHQAELKLRSRFSLLFDKKVTVTYASDHPMDALYDLCINVLDLTTADVNVKSFYDAKDSLGSSINITRVFSNEEGWDAALELARAGRSSLYLDRRGRLAAYYWNDAGLTATGDELVLSKETNLISLQVRERDELIINKQVINWSSDLSLSHTVTDTDSIEDYNILQGSDVNIACLDDEQYVVALADAVMALRAQPPLEAVCQIGFDILRVDVGRQVVITEDSEGWDEKLFVVVGRTFDASRATGTLKCLAPNV